MKKFEFYYTTERNDECVEETYTMESESFYTAVELFFSERPVRFKKVISATEVPLNKF